MATQGSENRRSVSLTAGANLVALAGLGLIVYGLLFLVRNFTGFIELGLTAENIGETPAEIRAFSPNLYDYISHLHVALSGLLVAMGVAVLGLAMFGIRRGENWALWTAFLMPMIALGIALPLHYPYHLATLGHLGPIYLDAGILLIGIILSYRAIKA